MVFGKLFIQKAEAKGIKVGEVLAAGLFDALKEAAAETAVSPEADKTEAMVAGFGTTLLSSLDSSIKAALDFDKDGKIG